MIYKEILDMVADAAYNKFIHGLDYDGLKSTIVECATKIYIAQMQLEKEKLQEEDDPQGRVQHYESSKGKT